MTDGQVHRVIAGFGRSGTTWVQDSIAEANSLRAVFEPMHPSFVPGAAKYAYRYASGTQEVPGLSEYLKKYFCDDYHSLWVDYRIVRKHLVPVPRDLLGWPSLRHRLHRFYEAGQNYSKYRRQRDFDGRLVKLIRANMMLGWLKEKFGAKIIFVIRHPVPVVLSQLRSPESWDPRGCIDRYRADSHLLEALDGQTRRALFGPTGDVEAYALCWCIENKVALQQAGTCGIPVLHYELLIQNGRTEWRRAVDGLGLSNVPDEVIVAEPSQQAWGEKAKDAGLLRCHSSWMRSADPTIIKRVQRVLDETGMTIYNIANALPSESDLAKS